MIPRAFVFALILVAVGSEANAQIIQAVNRFANAGEPEKQTNAAVEEKKDDKGALLLSQASAQGVGTDKAQIALQALDLWMSRKTRLYARLTLPVKAEPAEKKSDETPASTEEPKPSDGIVKQLVDPYGGIVNLSGGLFTRLGKRGVDSQQEEDIKTQIALNLKADTDRATAARLAAQKTTDADALKAAVVAEDAAKKKAADAAVQALSKMQAEHGAYLDIRGGIKLLDLPNPGVRAVELGGSKLNVFYSGIAGLKVILPLFTRSVNLPDAEPGDLAGGVTLGAYVVGNHAADTTQSDIFTTALNRSTTAFTAVVGINLPGIAGLTFSMTPWTSDSRMGKTFVFGFDVLRPTKGDAGKE